MHFVGSVLKQVIRRDNSALPCSNASRAAQFSTCMRMRSHIPGTDSHMSTRAAVPHIEHLVLGAVRTNREAESTRQGNRESSKKTAESPVCAGLVDLEEGSL